MTLFVFTVDGGEFALPGGDVLQVVPPGEVLDADGGGAIAIHRGRRLPVLALPFTGGTPRQPASDGTFLLVAGAGDAVAGLLRVDRVGGLLEVADADLLPLPAYLFPDRGMSYQGLFPAAAGVGAVVRRDCLRGATRA